MKYSKMEEFRMQVAEGRRRHLEENDNIRNVPRVPCAFDEGGTRKTGTVVGTYTSNTNTISAYHIIGDDGRRMTLKSSLVTIERS